MSDPEFTRVVADADVLAADLLVGGDAREALDAVREHSWMTLVASDHLLDDAEAVIADVADAELAADWREKAEAETARVEHSAGDHPGLASAHFGSAAHLPSFDSELRSAHTGATIKKYAEVSIKSPGGFATLFDAAAAYEAEFDMEYSGPDRDPCA
jgi:hypothetical protein